MATAHHMSPGRSRRLLLHGESLVKCWERQGKLSTGTLWEG